MSENKSVLLLGACGSAGINFARSVKEEGWTVVGADLNATKLNALISSGVLDSGYLFRDKSHQAVYDLLSQEGDRFDVIHAQPDNLVRSLCTLRARSDLDVDSKTWPLSYQAIEFYSNKIKTQNVVNHYHGSFDKERKVLDTFGMTNNDIITWLRKNWTHDTMWIRFNEGAGSKGASPVVSPEQAFHWVKYWSYRKPNATFSLYKYLEGREIAVQAIFSSNAEIKRMEARLRNEYHFAEQMVSGQSSTPSIATSMAEPKISKFIEKAVENIIFYNHGSFNSGIYGFDLKEDENGDLNLMEINYGRFYSTSYFFTALGSNMPAYYCDAIASGDPISYTKNSDSEIFRCPSGRRWVRLLDLEPILL